MSASLLLLGAGLAVDLGAKEKWPALQPGELGVSAPVVEADAAAEALEWRIEVDDRDFPASRVVKEYVKYKIFDVQKAEKLLRLSQQAASVDGVDLRNPEMSARLTLPDGTVKEFGHESVRERELLKAAKTGSVMQSLFGAPGAGVKEKYLAVGGVQAGAVLEYRLRIEEQYPRRSTFRTLQMEAVPVRKLEFSMTPASDSERYYHSFIVLNSQLITYREDKGSGVLSANGKNLPSLVREPFSGGPAYTAVTAVSNYGMKNYISRKNTSGRRTFSADQPWGPYATMQRWMLDDQVEESSFVNKTAAKLCEGAVDKVEKARRIHDFVLKLHLRFLRWGKRERMVVRAYNQSIPMKEVLNFETSAPEGLTSQDFLSLAVSLCRAAGLRAELVMLPNRALFHFNPRLVSAAFLQDSALAVHDGSAWHFSLPNARFMIGFDQLPWANTAVPGLLALDGEQQFVEVPRETAEANLLENGGEFSFDAEGTLTGDCVLSAGGQDGILIRSLLYGRSPEKQKEMAKTNISRQFEGAEISIESIENVEDAYAPVVVKYRIQWPGYATPSDERLIFRPFVFRSKAVSPFTATERRGHVLFNYNRMERDKFSLKIPEGYELEVKQVPPSAPGESFSHLVSFKYSKKTGVLHIEREQKSAVPLVPLKAYAALKQWHDDVVVKDQYSMILVRKEPASPGAATALSEPGKPAPVPVP